MEALEPKKLAAIASCHNPIMLFSRNFSMETIHSMREAIRHGLHPCRILTQVFGTCFSLFLFSAKAKTGLKPITKTTENLHLPHSYDICITSAHTLSRPVFILLHPCTGIPSSLISKNALSSRHYNCVSPRHSPEPPHAIHPYFYRPEPYHPVSAHRCL